MIISAKFADLSARRRLEFEQVDRRQQHVWQVSYNTLKLKSSRKWWITNNIRSF